MTRQQITDLPLYPEDRACTAPTVARVFDHLAPLQCQHLTRDGQIVQTFDPQLTPLQAQLLEARAQPPLTTGASEVAPSVPGAYRGEPPEDGQGAERTLEAEHAGVVREWLQRATTAAARSPHECLRAFGEIQPPTGVGTMTAQTDTYRTQMEGSSVATFAGEGDELQQFGELVEEWTEKLLAQLRAARLPDDHVWRWRQTASRLSETIEKSVPPSLDPEHVAEVQGELLAILRDGLEEDEDEPLNHLESALLHLEAIRHIVRDALDQHVLGEHDARLILRALEEKLPRVGRKDLARLVGLSDRSIQRILAEKKPVPPQRRLLLIARLVELLHRGWSPEGVVAWFDRPREELDGQTVLEAIADPACEHAILGLARHGRAQHGS